MSATTVSHQRTNQLLLPPVPPAAPGTLSSYAVRVAFALLHLVPLAALWTGFDLTSLLLCLACYLINMVGVTVGYHRYFSHRSYKTSRWFQFLLAFMGCTALQKGPLWWASHHRHHHRHSDGPQDVHSPVSGGLFWSHLGWVFASDRQGVGPEGVKDLERFPELRWLERFHWVPAALLAAACFLVGGWSGLVVGFFLSNVLSHHVVFLVNSACHLWGTRRYETGDASRNNALVAVLTLGEGWHNNHHHYQSSARQGFRWWEIDLGYYFIRALSAAGLVWGVREVPAAKLATAPRPEIAQEPAARIDAPAEAARPASLGGRLVTLGAVVVPLLGLAAAVVLLWGWGFRWVDLGLLVGMYLLTAFGITVGFHRLFAHRSFRTNPVVEFALTVFGSMAVQASLFSWVAHHRIHHKHSDTPDDPHTPHHKGAGLLGWLRGFWHAHLGWAFTPDADGLSRYVKDLDKSASLRVASALFPLWVILGLLIPAAVGGLVSGTWAGALLGLIWGGLVRVLLVHHVTWSVNSVCHLWGLRPYDSGDESRDNVVFGVLAMGEGWHNGHHAFPTSARHGLSWWKIDVSYYLIRLLAFVRLAWDVRLPTPEALAKARGA